MKRLLITLTAMAMLSSCAHYPWEKKKTKKQPSVVVYKPASSAKLQAKNEQISALNAEIKRTADQAKVLQLLLEYEKQKNEEDQDKTTSSIENAIEAQREILKH